MHKAQPGPVRKSNFIQQSTQNWWSASTTAPQPGQRGGNAKSIRGASSGCGVTLAVVARCNAWHKRPVNVPPTIFDPTGRRLRRDRAARQGSQEVENYVAEAIVERLDAVSRSFDRALVINTGHGLLSEKLSRRVADIDETDHGNVFAQWREASTVDEDRLDVAWNSYDLVVLPTGLDTVDDLPGALIAARRALRADGLFLACLSAAPSLPTLRRIVAQADMAKGVAAARIHPQIEVRDGGDLLVRAGFALPVADLDSIRLAYLDLGRLIADLRSAGSTNVLRSRAPVDRAWYAAACAAFEAEKNGGERVEEIVTSMTLTGWAPSSVRSTP